MMGKTPVVLFTSLLIAGLVFILYLGKVVMADLSALSTAQHDNVSWNMSQLEIDALQLERVAHDVALGHADDLGAFRKRYDIFYSRVQTLTQSAYLNEMRQQAEAEAALMAADGFLRDTTPTVDGPDDALRTAMPGIQIRVNELRPQLRALALAGIEFFAQADAQRRAEFSQTLVKFAASVVTLILILVVGLVILVKFYRRGQQVAHDNHVMRSRFEAAVSSSLNAVLVVDITGKIIEFNGAAETVFGYTRDEALGGDMAELIVPEHLRDMHRKGMARYLETNEQKLIGAGRIRLEGLRKSGEVFPVELSILFSEAEGERVFVSYLRDITRELEAEKELRTARDKAQESERAKTDLLTVMSHEMRTPLNGILGSLALLDKGQMDARQKRHLNSIAVSGELLLSHVNDVLDLSSLDSEAAPQEQAPFDLQDMVQKMADSLGASAEEHGNQLTVAFLSDGLGTVLGAKRSLQQCLVNLVGNAIKFTTGGVIAIEVERLGEGDTVEIRVSDTGVGIAPENLERIFDEFVTIDTAYARRNTGTGLGLAITKRLVEAMDGEIDADSLLGEGSLFTIRLPLAEQASESDQLTEPGADHAPPLVVNTSALVVDDNEINRMILADMLTGLGFTVEEAEDGYSAIEKLEDKPFDVVLLDISMPGIDGMETLHRIRALDVSWRDVPALAVTAHAAPKDHAKILEAPFSSLLVKPVRPDELHSKLASVLQLGDAKQEDPIANSAGGQFRAQFGEEKYRAALQGFFSELHDLISGLENATDLAFDLRQLSHKLSGSAAVLGEDDLRDLLQEIEHCSKPDWSSKRAKYMLALQEAIVDKRR